MLTFLLSSIPGSSMEKIQRPTVFFLRFLSIDPVGHVVGSAVLAFLLHRAFRTSPMEGIRVKALSLAFIVAAIFALSDELHQLLISLALPFHGNMEERELDFICNALEKIVS